MKAFQAICDAGSCTNSVSDVNQLSWVLWLGTAEQTRVWLKQERVGVLCRSKVKYSLVYKD